jgi:hypothetical protein
MQRRRQENGKDKKRKIIIITINKIQKKNAMGGYFRSGGRRKRGVGGGKFDGENFQVRALSLLLRDMFGWPVERHAGNR